MAYADDLLKLAFHLVHKERMRPKQASLRRSVSTSYYALFHLLIDDAIANWRLSTSRARLARVFDHRTMKVACNSVLRNAYPGENPMAVSSLKEVASKFCDLQAQRHIADYDIAFIWVRTEALSMAEAAESAFDLWKSIRKERIAQDFLVSLLVKNRD